MKAQGASLGRIVVALAVTVVVSEACYRYVETPIRTGALARLAAQMRHEPRRDPTRTRRRRFAFVGVSFRLK